jgi:DNA-binding NarL/FixJ family response regulator
MARPQPRYSPTDEHARRIARAIAKGRPPPFSAELDRYCENASGEIFAAFAGAARHMPPAGNDEALAVGYLFLLQRLLEHLRYRTDRGYAEAAKLIADFQADVVARVEAGDVDATMLAFVGGALHQSKIAASPELAAATAKQPFDQDGDGELPADVSAALRGILDACGGDPFLAVGSLSETGHAMPTAARAAMAAALADAGTVELRGLAVLFLLDADSAVRRAVAQALARVAASLSPIDIRRLIAMRNWRPENERAEVDAIIRSARAAGIDCAQWEAGIVEAIFATAIDGSASQGFLMISPAGRKKRVSSILTKRGIADAWSGEPESRRQIEASLAAAGMDAPMLAVSRSYFDRAVAHHLALSTEKGEAAPFGLLQVAETIGGADWRPARMDFADTLAELMAEVPKAMCEPSAVAALLRNSDQLAGLAGIANCWFEDDPQAAQAVKQARGRNRAQVTTYLLQSVIARRRDRWAEIFLRTAAWMHEAPPHADLCWRELAIVAKSLADGQDVTEIALMRDIALRTIEVLRNIDRM